MTSGDTFLIHGDIALIRGTALQGYPELVTELGANPDTLLSAMAISRTAVGDHDSFLSFRAVLAALEAAAETTRTIDFGRRLAARQGIEILGPLAAAARTAPTTGAAFAALSRHLAVYTSAISAGMTRPAEASAVRCEFRVLVEGLPPHPQSIEHALGIAVRTARTIIGRTYTPISVHLPHRPLAPEHDYREYFGCPVRFAEPFSGFLMRPEDLLRPLAADTAVRTVVETYLDSLTPPPGRSITGPVRALIRQLLPTGTVDRHLIAAQLAVHPRTLQRRLAEEGITFTQLIDETRRTEAERYLRDTDLPLGRLATLLGFSEQSAFSRACHRWFGTSATNHRNSIHTRRTTAT
ncbi:AraC family transcriptional regulator ligand-binding domain-containing protein [Nocardia sp. JMUB6875]|uniref:AraC family transcriptional regulator n=1 Tax=Nocardia sp. JMUB6875 TaxID=3158170 RepID=UPI0034E89B8C